MGRILKTKFYLKSSAAGSSVLVRKFITPLIIHEPTDSPGWTLAVITIPFLFGSVSKFYRDVIVNISHLLPAKVSQSVWRLQKDALFGSYIILDRSSSMSV